MGLSVHGKTCAWFDQDHYLLHWPRMCDGWPQLDCICAPTDFKPSRPSNNSSSTGLGLKNIWASSLYMKQTWALLSGACHIVTELETALRSSSKQIRAWFWFCSALRYLLDPEVGPAITRNASWKVDACLLRAWLWHGDTTSIWYGYRAEQQQQAGWMLDMAMFGDHHWWHQHHNAWAVVRSLKS